MNHLSLFSGSGIGTLAAAACGISTVAHAENDPACCYCLERLWPDVRLFRDVQGLHSRSYLDAMVKTWYLPENGTHYSDWENKMAGKLKKLTEGQAAESVKMYEAGMSLQDIATYFQVSRQAMWDLVRRRTKLRSNLRYGKENHFYRGGQTADDSAQNMLEKAIERGVVKQQTKCETCGDEGTFKDGRSKIQAHHCDYNKPLDVMWLCQKCHHKWHKTHTATRKEVQQELPENIDIISGGFP